MKTNINTIKAQKIPQRKQGFTLVEILVTLGVFSLLLPGVLMLSAHLGRQAQQGIEHGSATGKARLVQQFFVGKANACKSFTILDSGNVLMLKMYNPATSNWQNNAISYLANEQALNYYEVGSDGTLSEMRTVSDHVYRNGTNAVFSSVGNRIRCTLLINESISDAAGIRIDLSISPRNAGRIQ